MIDKQNAKAHAMKVFPFGNAADALDFVEKGHIHGKVVIEIMRD
jgi:hypothetical protein